jgi:hypothetical protein
MAEAENDKENCLMIFTKYSAIFGWLMTLILVVVVMDAKASSQQDLEVTLSRPTSTTNSESGIVFVTIKNNSPEPILMPIQWAPLSGPGGRLMGPVFVVIDASGKEANYKGLAFRLIRDSSHPETLYTRIEAGQTMSGEVNLAQEYDLKAGGAYRVSYKQYYGSLALLDENSGTYDTQHFAQSNVLDIWVNSSLI